MLDYIDGVAYEAGSAEEAEAMRAMLLRTHGGDEEAAEAELAEWVRGRDEWLSRIVPEDQRELSTREIIKALMTGMPVLTVGILDALALRMRSCLPDYDESQAYTLGMLVVMADGRIYRKVTKMQGDWREVG